MMKYLAALALLLVLVPSAQAGRRCSRQSWHSLSSTHGWGQSCWTCHKQQQAGGWQESILNIKKWQLNYSAFNEALKSITPADQYGEAGAYGVPSSLSSITGTLTNATQGSTLYGLNQFASQINTPDISFELHQAAQLAKDSAGYGAQAVANLNTLLGQVNSNNTNVAAILARGHVAAQALQAASGSPEAHEQTVQFEARFKDGQIAIVPQTPNIPTDAPQTQGLSDDVQRGAVITQDCAGCHGGDPANIRGDFDITTWQTWTGADRARKIESIQRHVTATDPAVRMPHAGDGPGEPLPWEKLKLFVNWE